METFSYENMFTPILDDIYAEMRAIRDAQTEISPIFWAVVDYQFGWDDAAGAVGKILSGKKIRPLLMALVAQAVCGTYKHVLAAGAALELLHNFTLLHDDVMDNALERRHRPAVWTLWGKAQAINCGDGLYALSNMAMARLLTTDAPPHKIVRAHHAMSQACLWTAEGQILDVDFENRDDVRPDEYITMVSNKTGTLIEAAAFIGALLSTDDEPVAEAYASFARNLGVAFQVRDDYLDVWGDTEQTGKPVATDIREKKRAYPYLMALQRASEQDRAALKRIYAQNELSDDDVQAVLAIMAQTDAATYTDEVARQYYETAMQQLDNTGIQNETQDQIRELAAFLIKRAY